MGLTELMSNVALVTIFVPVVFGIADGFHLNPIWLAMPVTFCRQLRLHDAHFYAA